jgi:hypothetical protein
MLPYELFYKLVGCIFCVTTIGSLNLYNSLFYGSSSKLWKITALLRIIYGILMRRDS